MTEMLYLLYETGIHQRFWSYNVFHWLDDRIKWHLRSLRLADVEREPQMNWLQ